MKLQLLPRQEKSISTQMGLVHFPFLLWVSKITFYSKGRKTGEDVCFMSTFEKTCPPGMTVHVLSAKLGRMEENPCLGSKVNLGCYDDVSQQMREKCYGRETCSEYVGSLGPFIQSCPKNIMTYLHIDTECRIGMFLQYCLWN